ncbi:hypothetical protein LOZ10_006215 [Ophidiomyces ophidiicola]|nr:hypothetical protein LOZ10_006215 [Ophidiomyces ophidiicola]
MLRLTGLVPRLNLPVPVSLFVVYAICLTPILVLLYVELAKRQARANPRGCRRLGLQNVSNNADEHDYDQQGFHKRATNGVGDKEKKIKIKALITYPIKSCAGVEFNFIDAVNTGFAYDRQFCFAEFIENKKKADGDETGAANGRWDCRTLRDGKFSKMALIRSEIWIPDPSSPAFSPRLPEVQSQGVLVIRYPRITDSFFTNLGMKLGLCASDESFQVPLHPPKDGSYPSIPIRIFSDTPHAYNYGAHVPASLSTLLGSTKPLSLFRSDANFPRPVRGNAPPADVLGFKPTMGFPDEYPLQLQNIASIRNMGERVNYAIPRFTVRRFRPNIVLEGAEAYAEDDWKRIRVTPGRESRVSLAGDRGGEREKSVDMFVSCHTVRCRLPNVDPETGERHAVEPDKTLRTTRDIDAGAVGKGCLGMMLVPVSKSEWLFFIRFLCWRVVILTWGGALEFVLHVGDEIEVLERGEHIYLAA